MPQFVISEADRLLLSFVLATDDRLGDWNAWRDLMAIADIDGTTHELLPSLYKRLEAMAYAGDELARLRGIYRYHWTRSQQRIAAARAVRQTFSGASLHFIGPADETASSYLAEPGTLPLHTPRFTVRYKDSGAALDALADAGWEVSPSGARRSIRARLVQSEWELEDSNGHRVLLSNFFNHWLRSRSYQRTVWARTTGIEGTTERQPHVADLLLASLTDEIAYAPALRWAVSSLAVAASAEQIEHLTAALDAPVIRYLLPPLEARLAALHEQRPDVRTVEAALTITRAAQQRTVTPDTATRPGVRQRVADLGHVIVAAPRIVRRFGGVNGTRRYLARSRR